jgi:hypothetical protein
MGMTLPELVERFRRWLLMPDPAPVLVALAAVAANRMSGNPVWLLLLGPASSGKTEILESLANLPYVHPSGKVSEAGLLSGSPDRDRMRDTTGGLLRRIGSSGIVTFKDFGSILNMHSEALQSLLAAFREIYDGRLTRDLGTDGGRRFEWRGKLGLLGGCTPNIDARHAVMNTMGERFMFLRIPNVSPEDQVEKALENSGLSQEQQSALAQGVADFFDTLQIPDHAERPSREKINALRALASLVVKCRSATERNPYSREIEVVPEPEAPPRLAVMLERIWSGLDAVGVEAKEGRRLIQKVAFDSMPLARLRIIEALSATPTCRKTLDELGEVTGCSNQATRRKLEDLTAYRVVVTHKGKPFEYELSEWARSKLETLGWVPEPRPDE